MLAVLDDEGLKLYQYTGWRFELVTLLPLPPAADEAADSRLSAFTHAGHSHLSEWCRQPPSAAPGSVDKTLAHCIVGGGLELAVWELPGVAGPDGAQEKVESPEEERVYSSVWEKEEDQRRGGGRHMSGCRCRLTAGICIEW